MTSNVDTDLKFSFDRLCKVAQDNGHKHGWGVSWLENGELRLEKDKQPIWESERASSLIQEIKSNLIVVHARKNASQEPSKVRSHPFLHEALGKQWIFAHNGTIKCPEPRGHIPESDVDSERFFCHLLDVLEQSDRQLGFKSEEEIVLEALRMSIRETKIVTALNFILANSQNLYVARLCEKNEQYYDLRYLRRSWKNKVSRKVGKRPEEVAVVFSSERLSEESWKHLGNGQLGVVPVGTAEELRVLDL